MKNNFFLVIVLLLFSSCTLPVVSVMPVKINPTGQESITRPEKEETEKKEFAAKESKNWTIMFYMAGDNNLAPEVIQDLQELEESGFDSSKVNMIVLCDVASSYGMELKGPNLLNICNDDDRTKIASEKIDLDFVFDESEKKDLNMADPETLIRFIDFAKDKFPASHYALFIWGHGSGWRSAASSSTRAIAFDDSSKDFMELPVLRQTLEKQKDGKKLDLICFDTCFGSELEVLFELKDCCSWFCGAESLVDSAGLDYKKWIGELDFQSNDTGKTLGDAIVKNNSGFSLTDCSYVQQLFDGFDEISSICAKEIDSFRKDLILQEVKKYSVNYFYGGTSSDIYVDLYNLTSLLTNAVPSLNGKVQAFKEKFQSAVTVKNEESENLNRGMGIYFCSLDANNSIIKKFSNYYIKGSGVENQSLFVKKSNGYVPTKNKEGSLLDVLIIGE